MSAEIVVYTDSSTLTEDNLKNLSPILSFHWKDLTLAEIMSGRSNPASPLRLTNEVENSDCVVLPMHWTYYLWNKKELMPEATALAKKANENGKSLIVWFKGDLVPIVPFTNASVFLPGPIRSRSKPNQVACPVFIDDPLPVWGDGKDQVREKKEIPTVGFCGYGSLSKFKLAWSIIRGVQLNAYRLVGRYDYSAIPIVPATVLRNKAISLLKQDSRIKTSFIIRDKYTHRTNSNIRLETADPTEVFFSNIYETDYTLCVRGYGNWSYRFYETLACGRIPVFIDTDCGLPLSSTIDWRRYCVWVDQSELHMIGEKILDFHSTHTPAEFAELQVGCRRLWLERLSLPGFMAHIRSSVELHQQPFSGKAKSLRSSHESGATGVRP